MQVHVCDYFDHQLHMAELIIYYSLSLKWSKSDLSYTTRNSCFCDAVSAIH